MKSPARRDTAAASPAARRWILGNGDNAGKFRVRDIIEFSEEFDGFEIFTSAELVGNPFTLLARIVEVNHRGHGVHAQAVNVKAVEPEQRIGGEKIGNFMPAKLKMSVPQS